MEPDASLACTMTLILSPSSVGIMMSWCKNLRLGLRHVERSFLRQVALRNSRNCTRQSTLGRTSSPRPSASCSPPVPALRAACCPCLMASLTSLVSLSCSSLGISCAPSQSWSSNPPSPWPCPEPWPCPSPCGPSPSPSPPCSSSSLSRS